MQETMFGLPIVVSPHVPSRPPTTTEVAVRRVRYELKALCPEALRTLDPGPRPDEPVEQILLVPEMNAYWRMGYAVMTPGVAHILRGISVT